MTIALTTLRWLALDPEAQASFWGALLDAPVSGSEVEVPGLVLRFEATTAAKTLPGRTHLDVTSDSLEHQRALVDRALRHGAHHHDVGQRGDEGHVVLADPEGNELCVIEPGNGFLAGAGRVGALNCDGTHALGVFWSRVLDLPLVWDEGEETAVELPGGTKVTWSGPPLMARESPERTGFHLRLDGEDDRARLVELGATALDAGRFSDPDGNVVSVAVG